MAQRRVVPRFPPPRMRHPVAMPASAGHASVERLFQYQTAGRSGQMGEQIPVFFCDRQVWAILTNTPWSAIGCRTPIAELMPVVAA